MIECLSGVEKLFELTHLETLLVKARLVHGKPLIWLLDMEEVFSGEPDRVPNLLSVNQVRIIDERAMQGSKPQLDTENSIFVDFYKVTASFLELTDKHSLEEGGNFHQDLMRDFHHGGLENRMVSIVIGNAVIIFNHLDYQVAR